MSDEVGRVSLGLDFNSKPLMQQANALHGKLENVFSGMGKKLEGTFGEIGKNLAKAIGIGLSAKAILDFGKNCLDLGSDLAEVQNVVDVTFTSMSGKIDEFAQNAAMQFGLSETMAKRYAGTFGAMSKAFGFAEADAAEMSMTLTGLAGDVASFYNIDQDAAYTKLKSVFSGETQSLKDLGIVMTQTALDQFALQNGFGKTTAAMSEQEKVALRYQFILSKLSDVSGDFARTSDGWANQVRILKLQFESLCSVIGSVLIEALSPAIQTLNSFMGALVKAANTFKSFVFALFGKESQDMMAGTAAAISDVGVSAADAMDGLGESAGNAADDTKKAANDIQRALMGFDQINKLSAASSASSSGGSGGSGGGASAGSLGDVSSALKNTAYEISESESPLTGFFERLFDPLKKAWDNVGSGVMTAIQTAFNTIKQTAVDIGTSFMNVWTNGTGQAYVESLLTKWQSFANIVSALAGTFDAAWNAGGRGDSVIQSIFDKATAVNNLIGSIGQAFANVWNDGIGERIWGNILDIIRDCNNFVGNLATSISDAWNTAGRGEGIWTAILTPVNTILEHIRNITSATAEWAANLDFGPLLDSVQRVLEAIDPIADLAGSGLEALWENVLKPLASWTIEDAVPAALGVFSGALDVLKSAIEAISPYAKTFWDDFLEPIAEWTGDAIVTVLNGMADALSGLSQWISENSAIVAGMAAFVATLVTLNGLAGLAGIITGIGAAVGGFITALSMASSPLALIEAFAIANPFGAIAVAVGLLVAAGVALYENWDTVCQWAETLKEKVSDAFSAIGDWVSGAWENIKSIPGKIKDTIDALLDYISKIEIDWMKIGTKDFIKLPDIDLGATISTIWAPGAEEKIDKVNELDGKTTNTTISADMDPDSRQTLMVYADTDDKTPEAKIGAKWGTEDALSAALDYQSILDKSAAVQMKAQFASNSDTVNISTFAQIKDKLATVDVSLKKSGWNTVADLPNNNMGGAVNKIIGLSKNKWTSLQAYVSSNTGGAVNKLVGLARNKWTSLYAYVGGYTGGAVNKPVGVTKGWKGSLQTALGLANAVISVKAAVSKKLGASDLINKNSTVDISATTSGVRKIKQLATIKFGARGGILDAATFVRPDTIGGEAGREALLPLEHNTEWMDTWANTAASAVVRLLGADGGNSGFSVERCTPHLAEIGNGIRQDTAALVSYAKQAAVASQGGGVAEVVSLLRQILYALQTLDLDVELDGQSVKKRIVDLINQRTQATGFCEIIT